MRALWLKGNIIANIVDYGARTTPAEDGGYPVVEDKLGTYSVGDKYIPPPTDWTPVVESVNPVMLNEMLRLSNAVDGLKLTLDAYKVQLVKRQNA